MEWPAGLLLATPLFAGFSAEELQQLLPQLAPTERHYQRGETLLDAGGASTAIGIVLAGEIEAAKFTRAGDQFTVQQMGPGGIFGDVLSASHSNSPVTVTAATACRVLLLPNARLFAPPPAHDALHRQLLVNLVTVVSDKYFMLDARIDLLLIRGLRKRIAAYLLDCAPGREGEAFAIPFNRAGLAQYLGCDRSALSRELSAMAADGLLEVRRQVFRLPNAEALRQLF